jgi:hypothetical protein
MSIITYIELRLCGSSVIAISFIDWLLYSCGSERVYRYKIAFYTGYWSPIRIQRVLLYCCSEFWYESIQNQWKQEQVAKVEPNLCIVRSCWLYSSLKSQLQCWDRISNTICNAYGYLICLVPKFLLQLISEFICVKWLDRRPLEAG